MEVATGRIRKRKAENQDNERLSKRLSLLNLGLCSPPLSHIIKYHNLTIPPEQNGRKLYVPVDTPNTPPPASPKSKAKSQESDDIMHLDDTAHKVYIYDLDAELSDSESSDDGKLVFLPDIEKHLRETRIPPSVLANSEGELAGCNQLVLYNIPTSLSVPKEQDSVRKAIIETRARAREKQRERKREQEMSKPAQTGSALGSEGVDVRDWYGVVPNGRYVPVAQETMDMMNGASSSMPTVEETPQDDSDAMDLD